MEMNCGDPHLLSLLSSNIYLAKVGIVEIIFKLVCVIEKRIYGIRLICTPTHDAPAHI